MLLIVFSLLPIVPIGASDRIFSYSSRWLAKSQTSVTLVLLRVQ
jgi:hypothetical protein